MPLPPRPRADRGRSRFHLRRRPAKRPPGVSRPREHGGRGVAAARRGASERVDRLHCSQLVQVQHTTATRQSSRLSSPPRLDHHHHCQLATQLATRSSMALDQDGQVWVWGSGWLGRGSNHDTALVPQRLYSLSHGAPIRRIAGDIKVCGHQRWYPFRLLSVLASLKLIDVQLHPPLPPSGSCRPL